MPVEATEGGFRWGKRGHVYRTRAQAERQGRAILASGWREDSPKGRRSRRQIVRLLSASRRAETRYVADVLGILRGVHRGVMQLVRDEVLPAAPEPDQRHDTGDDPAERARRALSPRLQAKIAKHVRQHVGPAFDRMASVVDGNNARAMALVGVSLTSMALAPTVTAAVDRARENNILLVENAGRAYADDVRDIFTDPENAGLRVEALQQMLEERGRVSESRASLIARDQTLKLNAAVSQSRMQDAGVDEYIWSTSEDERVRPAHAELEGQRFSFSDPPVTNDQGETNNPGQDFQCRCVARPIIDELDDEEPDE